MSDRRVSRLLMCICLTAGMVPSTPAFASDARDVADGDLVREPSWRIPAPEDLRARLLEWLTAFASENPAALAAVETERARWSTDGAVPASREPLDELMDAMARVDPRCRDVQRAASGAGELGWLSAPATAAFERDAVRLWLGRECVRRDRFDEGLSFFEGLDVTTAVDPATLLFHRAACEHWLLQADRAVESLDRLLERSGEIPVRYERIARLLRADIASLEDESLDHIARRMRDITRRLDLGRAGPKTLAVQDGVIESLDKLIKAIEQQQQQQSQASGGSGGSGKDANGTPMDDSRIAGGKGPGEVVKRDIGDSDGWGKLPPHEREEALQQIGREFPAHYREAIEQYFKKLAAGEEKK